MSNGMTFGDNVHGFGKGEPVIMRTKTEGVYWNASASSKPGFNPDGAVRDTASLTRSSPAARYEA